MNDTPHASGRIRRLVRLSIARSQGRIASALGVSRAHRTDTVVAMLESNARRAPGYWLQLFLSAGIALYGLVLGSTAVVIGGMLVSPLMGPIVELGMGFAVGSSLLVIRAFLRVVLSVFGVIAFAALATLTLPFHEINAEISSRTSPTLLDLLVAVFCALAAAYTTVRQTSDTTAAAAGTAIGISLVPPLCVAGYGVGTQSADIVSGSFLLFITNFSAIVLVAVLAFLMLGYNQVPAPVFERDYLEARGDRWTDRLASRTHELLRDAFGSRYGMAMRLAVPLGFLALVAIPLSRALDEVASEVRIRDAVRGTVGASGLRSLQTTLAVERQNVSLRLLVVGTPELATALQAALERRIREVSGIAPSVSVTAVPDAALVQSTMAGEPRDRDAQPGVAMSEAQRQIGAILTAAWPADAAGRLAGWSLEVTPGAASVVTVRHQGPPLGAAAERMLARTLAVPLQSAVLVSDVAFGADTLRTSAPDSAWLRTAAALVASVARTDSLMACVEMPARPAGARVVRDSVALALLRAAALARPSALAADTGRGWSLRIGATCMS